MHFCSFRYDKGDGNVRSVIFLIALILLISPVSALYIRDKPSVTIAIVGTNHLKRGTNVLTILAFNPAKEKRIIYDNNDQAMFFRGRENLLFTAYNVTFTLEGCRGIEVKTPTQKIPALPPMKPIQLKFVLKVGENVKAGKYTLKLRVGYDIINDVDVNFNVEQVGIPTVYNLSGNSSQYGTVTNYEIQSVLSELDIDYYHKELTIPIAVYVDREPVKLKVVSVSTKDFQAEGKGLLTIRVENIGEKVGRNAFLLLIPPSGFSVKIPSTTLAMPSMPMMGMRAGAFLGTGTTSIQRPTISTLRYTNAMYVGNLEPGKIVEATFPVKIDVRDAGNYTFEIRAVYLNEYGNVVESDPVPFGVHVSPPPEVKVVNVESKVYVGATGDVIVKLEFTKSMKEASAILTVSPPLSLLSSEYYLGDVKPNVTYTAVFKVEALKDAVPVSYPAKLTIKYKVLNEWTETTPIRIGINVKPKIEFEVLGEPKIAQGEEKVITVAIKNIGNFTVREATARITIVDPFTSTDDTAYIGTLRPGECKNISFKIKVNRDATPKPYGLNLEVKYKDPEGDWVISEPTKLVIVVTPAKPNFALFGAILGVVALTAIAYAFKRRKR